MPTSTPVQIELSEDERAQLESWSARHFNEIEYHAHCRLVLFVAKRHKRLSPTVTIAPAAEAGGMGAC
ncbi:MAG: hypothetical protein ACLP0J_10720 [Solirubrobacteraceae bacterium]